MKQPRVHIVRGFPPQVFSVCGYRLTDVKHDGPATCLRCLRVVPNLDKGTNP